MVMKSNRKRLLFFAQKVPSEFREKLPSDLKGKKALNRKCPRNSWGTVHSDIQAEVITAGQVGQLRLGMHKILLTQLFEKTLGQNFLGRRVCYFFLPFLPSFGTSAAFLQKSADIFPLEIRGHEDQRDLTSESKGDQDLIQKPEIQVGPKLRKIYQIKLNLIRKILAFLVQRYKKFTAIGRNNN